MPLPPLPPPLNPVTKPTASQIFSWCSFFPFSVWGWCWLTLSPWVSALPCLWDMSVWGGSESMFWKKKNPQNWNWATWCVSWLPAGFTRPLEHFSCSLQNADRAGKGSGMSPGPDLFLNLLTKSLLKLCQSLATAAQKSLQTTMKDLLFSQNTQTRTNHPKSPLAALSFWCSRTAAHP